MEAEKSHDLLSASWRGGRENHSPENHSPDDVGLRLRTGKDRYPNSAVR